MDKNEITEDYFYSKRHYKRFMLAVKYAEKINEYLEKGYIIIDGYDKRIADKFETKLYEKLPDEGKSPVLVSEHGAYYGFNFVNGKIYIEHTLKDIREKFIKFKIFKSDSFIKLGKL